MPSMHFKVRWPDQSSSDCYSPSTIIKEYLEIGRAYPLAEFVAISGAALHLASERVRQKYGYACSSALDQLAQIERRAASFDGASEARVVVEAFLS